MGDTLTTLVVWRTMPRWIGFVAIATAAAIAASTLLTKQHYVLDIFGGWLFAAVAYRFARQGRNT